MTRSTVLIIGYGEMGHAMQVLLADRHDLLIWNRHPVAGIEPVDLLQAAGSAEVIIYCIPVTPLATVAGQVSAVLQDHSLSLIISKGLDENGRTAPEVLASVYADRHAFGALYGPMISEEIIRHHPGFAQVGVSPGTEYRDIAALFAGSLLYLEASNDMIGLAWSVILKNIYAMLFGIADGLGLGDNVRGFLAVASLQELSNIVRLLGGDPATPYQLAGLGDMITTATSEGSHHHALGVRLAKGDRNAIAGEGVHTLVMVRRHSLFDTGPYPLFRLVQEIVNEPVDPASHFDALLKQLFE
ncbi:MAG: hypothetical protein ABFS22_02495 [Pseudomonadota bacterium]